MRNSRRIHYGTEHRYTYHPLVAIETSPRSIDRSFHRLPVRSAARNNAHYRKIRPFIDIVIPHRKSLPHLQPHEIRIFLVFFCFLSSFPPNAKLISAYTFVLIRKILRDYTFQGICTNKVIYAETAFSNRYLFYSYFLQQIIILVIISININFFFHQY